MLFASQTYLIFVIFLYGASKVWCAPNFEATQEDATKENAMKEDANKKDAIKEDAYMIKRTFVSVMAILAKKNWPKLA